MYAVEFQAPIENGIVRIPKQYRELQDTKKATFVVMYEYDKTTSKSNTINNENAEIKAFSNHSANLIDEWKDDSEDEVWK